MSHFLPRILHFLSRILHFFISHLSFSISHTKWHTKWQSRGKYNEGPLGTNLFVNVSFIGFILLIFFNRPTDPHFNTRQGDGKQNIFGGWPNLPIVSNFPICQTITKKAEICCHDRWFFQDPAAP